MQKFPHYIAITLFSVYYSHTQNPEQLFYKNIASQSFTKQNSYFLNPTFSISNTNTTSISILVKNSFKDFQGSPKFNLIGFSGRINERNGAGIGLFQQTVGVFTSFGAVANYAQKLKITENSNLYFGFNFIVNKNTLDRSKIQGNETDPTIANFIDTNVIAFQPALTYEINRFSFGMYIKDFLDYDLNSEEILTNFSEKTIAGHIMYTMPLSIKGDIFDNSILRFILTSNNTVNSTFTISTLLDIPNAGWLQPSYDQLYGIGFGLGVNVSKKISINYIYEQGKNALGSSNEVGITYNFDAKRSSIQDQVVYYTPNANNSNYSNDNDFENKELAYNQKNNNNNNNNNNFKTNENKKLVDISKQQIKRKKKSKKRNSKIDYAVIERDTLKNYTVKPIKIKEFEADLYTFKAKELPEINVRIRTLSVDSSVEPGFYLVTNVFSKVSNAEKFIIKLKEENYDPNYFIHPKTKFRYVYIAKTDTKDEMLTLYRSDKFKKYLEDKWILHVAN